MPRVLFINRSYWPDTEATGQLLTDLSCDLTEAFEVTVLAGLPNHVAEGTVHPLPGRDRYQGVDVVRCRHTRFSKHSLAGRLLNLVTFTLSALWQGLWLRERPDIIVTESDPFFLPLVGRVLKWWYRCRFVAYLQDIYPDVAIAAGKVREGWITRVLRPLLVAAYRQADRVVVLSEDMRRLCARNGVPADKLVIIPNWVDTTSIVPRQPNNPFRFAQGCDGKFVVMYSGNMGVGHLLEPLIDAAALLQDSPEIQFLLIGEGQQKARLQELAEGHGLANVRFLPYQPRADLANSLSAADLHVVSIRPEVAECLMPSKLYGVLAAGVPVLALAPDDCELSQLVCRHELGAICPTSIDAGQATMIASAIRTLKDDVGFRLRASARARQLAESEYERRHVTKRFQLELLRVLN